MAEDKKDIVRMIYSIEKRSDVPVDVHTYGSKYEMQQLTYEEMHALYVCVEKCAGRYTKPLPSKLIDQLSIKLKGLI